MNTNVAYVALSVGLISLFVLLALILKIKKMSNQYSLLQGTGGESDFVAAVARQVETVNGLRTDVADLRRDLTITQAELRDAIRHVAVIRYDALRDLGGRMSFSVAFLDDSSDGIVISSINGRTEGRTYVKGIKAGVSIGTELSPEEIQAIAMAQKGEMT